jgi:hypothetical protein
MTYIETTNMSDFQVTKSEISIINQDLYLIFMSYIWIHLDTFGYIWAFVCFCHQPFISYQLARAPLVVDSPLPVDVEVAPGGPQNSQWIKLWESSIRRMSGVHLHPGVEGHFENVLCGKNVPFPKLSRGSEKF